MEVLAQAKIFDIPGLISVFDMQDLLLSTNPMLLGLIGINTIALVSLLGSVVSQRDALNRLEQALCNSQPALPEEKLAGLLTPVIEEEKPLASAEAEVEEESRDEERGDGPARDLSGSGGRLRLRRVPCRRVSGF